MGGGNALQGIPQERLSGQDDRLWMSTSPSIPAPSRDRSHYRGRTLPEAEPKPALRWPLVGSDYPTFPLQGAALPTLRRQVCRWGLCLPGGLSQDHPLSGPTPLQARAELTALASPGTPGGRDGNTSAPCPQLRACRPRMPLLKGCSPQGHSVTLGKKGLGACRVNSPFPRQTGGLLSSNQRQDPRALRLPSLRNEPRPAGSTWVGAGGSYRFPLGPATSSNTDTSVLLANLPANVIQGLVVERVTIEAEVTEGLSGR